MQATDATRLAEELYGVEAEATRLPGDRDSNFLLRPASGGDLVLKVMHTGADPGLVDLQCQALAHLHRTDLGVALPTVLPTQHGAPFASATVDGASRLVWALSWVPGRHLADARPRSEALLESVGSLVARVDQGLEGFAHPSCQRELRWDLARAGWIRDELGAIEDPEGRALIEGCLRDFEGELEGLLTSGALPQTVLHGDANDYNILIAAGKSGGESLATGLIDFGDLHRSSRICGLAIAAAYALLGTPDPLAAAAAVTTGYSRVTALEDEEVACLSTLISMRLCVSVVTSALRRREGEDDPYLKISERPAWLALRALAATHRRFSHYALRCACGKEPYPRRQSVVRWLKQTGRSFAPVIGAELRGAVTLDLSFGSLLLGADPEALETQPLTKAIFRTVKEAGAAVGVGRYGEPRPLYRGTGFGRGGHPTDPARTVHLGLDLFAPAGTSVHTPLAGTVYCRANNTERFDYGPVVILEHEAGPGVTFFTLYGHLDEACLEELEVGQRLETGEAFASLGPPPTNGDWTPHLHFQLILDLLELDRDFPGVARAEERRIWTSLSPDPNLIVGLPGDGHRWQSHRAATLAARRERLGANLSLSYARPVLAVRGWRQYLYDEYGRGYLDFYNNVPHVGHSHPAVVAAIARQAALLNTNTRYLHENVVRYAEAITDLLPPALSVCYFLNSASEANELALRLARAHTGRRELIVLAGAYHGHTTTLIGLSPYKFDGPGGEGRPEGVHVAPLPDDFRGRYRREDPDRGRRYADDLGELSARLEGRLAAFLAESAPSVGGQILFPPGYLQTAFRHVREAGGVCIVDETQVGLGRLGTHLWGFESQGVTPDVVVFGKPLGNGHPVAAVVTTPDIAASFDNGMEFFSTFGGNTVSCAAGLAVLQVLAEERLQDNARLVGEHLLGGLRALQRDHPIVGDVRGSGLFLGVELVAHPATLEPAPRQSAYIVDRLREAGILLGTDGPDHNVLKLRGPMVVTPADGDRLLQRLGEVLAEDGAQPCLSSKSR